MTRQKTIPLRPLRDYVRYKTNVADINLEDSIACYIMQGIKKIYLLLFTHKLFFCAVLQSTKKYEIVKK